MPVAKKLEFVLRQSFMLESLMNYYIANVRVSPHRSDSKRPRTDPNK